MQEVSVSAPGKVILFGEHAVVYGKTAVAVSLDLRMKIKLVMIENAVEYQMNSIKVSKKWTLDKLKAIKTWATAAGDASNAISIPKDCIQTVSDLIGVTSTPSVGQMAEVLFLALYFSISCAKGEFPGVKVIVDSELPIGCGLGSSAALSTCIATALLFQQNVLSFQKNESGEQNKFTGLTSSELELINSWAFLAESIVHGTPSGIDNFICCNGGVVKFKEGKFTSIDGKPNLRVLLVNTQISRNTKTLVQSVRTKYNKYPQIIKPILTAIDAVADKSLNIFTEIINSKTVREDDYKTLEELILINHPLLASLGVSHPNLNQICEMASQFNFSAKLTGAGGGGCAYIFIPPYAEENSVTQLMTKLEANGFQCWETAIGGQGLRVETYI